MMKNVFAGLGMLLLLSGSVQSAPYNGVGPGVSIINASGADDYVSIEAAVAAINTTPLTGGDWTFLIASNLTETTKIALGQETNGHKITFQPAPSMTPTITFNALESTSLGWSAHFVIGTALKNNSLANVSTDNIVINGSNNGSTSRDLTIQNTLNANSTNLVAVVADSDGFVMRNCNLIVNASLNSAAIRLAAMNEGAFVNFTPDNGIIENCGITGIGTGTSGISIDRGGASANTIGQDNIVIRGNDIVSEYRGIIFADYRRVTITDNKIAVSSTATANSSSGIIFGTGSTSTTDPIIVAIENNEITSVRRAMNSAFQIHGIVLFGSAGAGAPRPVVKIRNNSVAGIEATSSAAAPSITGLAGIRSVLAGADVEVINNSVHATIPSQYTVTGVSTVNVGIGVSGSIPSSIIDIRNNIVRYESPLGYSVCRTTTDGSWNVDSNSYFNTGGALLGSDAGVDTADLAAWQASTSLDVNSAFQDPFVADPPAAGVWVSEANLRFTSPAAISFAGVPVLGISTDVDGTTRDTLLPYKGAFEGNGYVNARVADALQYH